MRTDATIPQRDNHGVFNRLIEDWATWTLGRGLQRTAHGASSSEQEITPGV